MTSIARAINAYSQAIVRPVAEAPRFFFAVMLLACLPAISYSIVDKSRILHFIVASGCEGALIGYCCCWIVSMINGRGLRKMIIIVGQVLSCGWAIVEVGSLTTTGMLISEDSFALVAETDAGEAAGFFAQYFTLNSLVTILCVAAITVAAAFAAAFLFQLLCRHRLGTSLAALVLGIIVFIGAFCSVRMLRGAFISDYGDYLEWIGSGSENPDLIRANELCFSAPFVKIPCLMNGYDMVNRNYDRWLDIQYDALDFHVTRGDSAQYNIVVVVGESFIRTHSSLYGYYLPTNPGLTAERDSGRLVVYDSVMTTANFTTPSLRNLFNLNDLSKDEEWYESVYFPLVMKKAGYSVYHYDNQTVGLNADRGISRMFYSPLIKDCVYDATSDSLFDYDGDFLNYVHSGYAPVEAHGPKLVIYHLKGQHFPASARYEGIPHFSAADITVQQPWLNDERRAEIAEYDNATIYNDSIVSAIAARFMETPTVMFYFSDHGEDCWDLAPMEARNKQMPDDPQWVDRQFHIPFFIWLSPQFIERYPQLTQKLRDDADRPFSLDNLGQMILEMCDIDFSPSPCEEKN